MLESATSESAVVFSWPRTNEILTTTEEELYALAASERYGTFGYLFFGHSDFGPWGVVQTCYIAMEFPLRAFGFCEAS